MNHSAAVRASVMPGNQQYVAELTERAAHLARDEPHSAVRDALGIQTGHATDSSLSRPVQPPPTRISHPIGVNDFIVGGHGK